MSDSVKKWHEMQEEKKIDPIVESVVSNFRSRSEIVESVVSNFRARSKVGIEKYGTTLHDNPDGFYTWIQHAQEEAMDFILYLEKIKKLNK